MRLTLLSAAPFVLLLAASAPVFAQEVTKKDLDDLKSEVASLKEELASLKKLDLDAKLKGIDLRLSTVEDLDVKVNSIMDKLDELVTASGVVKSESILGNMQSNPQFRDEMSKVVQGKIFVNNTSGEDRLLYINGVLWRAPAGLAYTHVPFGTVQTQLNANDAPREWKVSDWRIGADGHELTIGIQ